MALGAILLVEDDPVSRRFLTDALAELGEVHSVTTLAEARSRLDHETYALLIFDCQLPDGHSRELLAQLRQTPDQRNRSTPALALSADIEDSLADLLSAGFAQGLAKPLRVDTLLAACRQWLVPEAADRDSPPIWDDQQAARALGDRPQAIAALRGLLRQDLPQQLAAVERYVAAGAHAALNAELHRMRAACGFCGASELLQAIRQLADRPDDALSLAAFARACARLLQD